jgi:hypothetical protein
MTQTPSSHEYKKVLQPETKKKQKQTPERERERGGDRENIWGEIRSERNKKKKQKKTKINFLQKSNIRMVPTETKF